MKLSQELENLERYPFHMPGHKRNPKFNIVGSEIDITEIDGFDNLHNANDIILDIENRLTSLYKSKKSFLMVNGSTGGIISAIFATCFEGDKIIVARNCHKSVFNACFIKKLRVVYIEPEYDYENGFYKEIKQSTIDKAIEENPDASAVIITSPTYEGYISKVDCTIPLIIDAAHGAHLIDDYPNGDIVISSLHKTLPALTQTAVANVYNDDLILNFKLYIDIFETSSPSYVLMSSVEKGLDYIKNNSYHIEKFKVNLEKLKLLEVDDNAKIVISTAKSSITGTELASILRNEFKIEVEMASVNYVILILTIGDEKDAYNLLSNALIEIDKRLSFEDKKALAKPQCPIGEQTIFYSYSEPTSIESAIGLRSNEFVFAYPPDIPILCPNEVITKEIIDYIRRSLEVGVDIISDSGILPNKLLTKADL